MGVNFVTSVGHRYACAAFCVISQSGNDRAEVFAVEFDAEGDG